MIDILLATSAEDCKKILSGRKTLEIRKNFPNVHLPVRCYLYCKRPIDAYELLWKHGNSYYMSETSRDNYDKCCSGFVIAEFICNEIRVYPYDMENEAVGKQPRIVPVEDLKAAQMTVSQMNRYGNISNLYGWCISDVNKYNEFMTVNCFEHICKWYRTDQVCERHCNRCSHLITYPDDKLLRCGVNGVKTVEKPPQNWCYIINS